MDNHTPSASPTFQELENPSLPLFCSTFLVFNEKEIQERLDAAEHLQREGEMRLLKGDVSGVSLFDQAAELSPANASLFYRQGLALFEYGSLQGQERALLLASKKFKTATLLEASHREAWQMWGHTLVLLGTTYKEQHYFLEAVSKYRQAIALSTDTDQAARAELLWDYASLLSHIATNSEEAVDWHRAYAAAEQAASLVKKLPAEFWFSFGRTALVLYEKLREMRYLTQAIFALKEAVSLGASSEEWRTLARAGAMLYEKTQELDHFTQVEECFAAASRLKPEDPLPWLEWAQFLSQTGMRERDAERLYRCIETCQKGIRSAPKHPLLLAVWSEALALTGMVEDELEPIYEGQNKANEALEMAGEEPQILYAEGICLSALGFYFQDIDFYYQAIEKFQLGLSIDRTLARHWHAIAVTYTTIAEIDSDLEAIERSCRFFIKALELHPSPYIQIDFAIALSRFGEMQHKQKYLEEAVAYFKRALAEQKNSLYTHPDWWFCYAYTLDLLGDFEEDEGIYKQAIEIFSHVSMVDPDFPEIHHRLGIAFTHLGALSHELDPFYRAIHHYRLATRKQIDDEQLLIDEGITLLHIAERQLDAADAESTYRSAEHKFVQAVKLGSATAYYQLCCLYSMLGQYEKAIAFLSTTQNAGGLPPLGELLEDEWLAGLRATPQFQDFLSHLEKK